MNRRFYYLVFLLISCQPKVYELKKESAYQKNYRNGNMVAALSDLNQMPKITEEYNQVLYHIEKGRLFLLNQQLDSAILNFTQADLGQDEWKKFSYKNIKGEKVKYFDNRYTVDGKPVPNAYEQAPLSFNTNVRGTTASSSIATLKRPDRTDYYCYDFERPYLHLYTGLAFAMKGEQGVYVEARKLYELSQNLDVRKTPIHPLANYSSNPLVPLLAGFLFEQQGDENAALIQYEKALLAFENSNCELNYGVNLPKQLPKDIVRICKSLGFEDKVITYSKKYGVTLKKGEERLPTAIVITEVGITPYKQLHRVYITPDGVMHYKKPRFVTKSTGNIIEIDALMAPKKQIGLYESKLTKIGNQFYIWRNPMQLRISSEMERIPTPTDGKSVSQIINYDDRNWQTLPAELHYTRVFVEKDQKEYNEKETQKNYPLIGKGKCRLVYIPGVF
jgi:tetratricopeptide (TPR) repeat protein